jgi:hypothetical protein
LAETHKGKDTTMDLNWDEEERRMQAAILRAVATKIDPASAATAALQAKALTEPRGSARFGTAHNAKAFMEQARAKIHAMVAA